jgi:hypothetical protein
MIYKECTKVLLKRTWLKNNLQTPKKAKPLFRISAACMVDLRKFLVGLAEINPPKGLIEKK